MKEIRPNYMKIVCPNAPSMPVTLNNGHVMPAWYDLWQVSKDTEQTWYVALKPPSI